MSLVRHRVTSFARASLVVACWACSSEDAPGEWPGTEAIPGTGGTSATHDGGGARATASADAGVPLAIDDLSLVQNPVNVLSFYLDFRTETAASATVRVSCGQDYDETFHRTSATRTHSVFVMGLVPGARCDVTIEARTDDGRVGHAESSWAPEPLPAFLPEFELLASDARAQPGWTILNVSTEPVLEPLVVAIIDEHARYRWYYRRTSNDDPGGSADISIAPDGVLIGGSGSVATSLVDWEGQVLWEQVLFQHHDIRWIDENHLLFLSIGECPDYVIDTLVLYDRTNDALVWTWEVCDQYAPVAPFEDWTHFNAIARLPNDDAVLVSSRNQSALFKVRLDTRELEWVMGAMPAYTPDVPSFTFTTNDRFYEQHAPEVLADGKTLVLFDNGSIDQRLLSRVVEVAFDETTLTATITKEFRLTPDLFTPQWGDADRLDNGNTLGTWGGRLIDPSHVAEFTPDGTIVWHVRVPEAIGIYRSERVTAVPRGFVR